ncbi:MAG: serine/threonine-protein kinase, partial [Gemmataceae bacterium]
MTPSPADPALLLDEALIHFDQAWQHGTPPELADYLQRLPDELRREGLEELIKIDLECRWRRDAASAAVTANLDAYAQRFLALAAMPVSLIAWEYRVRHCWGDKPTHDEYTRRFADRGDEVRAALTQVDRDLADEFNAPSASHDLESAPADLLDELRRLRLLPLDQLNELRRLLLLGECNETRDLMRLLSERNWLTPYQAAKLAQGEAGELRVGPYVLLDRLGEGGVGQVFKAHHQDMNRMVALKVIRPEYLGDPDMVARFYREIQLTAQLEHVNLVHAFDAGPIGNLHVLIMEYVEGRDLGTLVKQEGALPMERACNYIRQAATGLQYIFEGNLVHRDIKPSNLVLTHTLSMERSANQSGPVATTAYPWGLVKILDLGLARFRRTDLNAQGDSASAHTLTDPGAVVMMGTPDFMAPEQILDFHGADIRADIYSLGCTYYYLLTGQAPFAEGTVSQKLVRHQ